MPRTKKDDNTEIVKKVTSVSKKATSKKSTVSEKKVSKKSTDTKSKATKTAKKTAAKKITKNVVKSNATRRSSSLPKKDNVKKAVSKKSKEDFINILEYYDLPYRYNETIVRILAQTPKILFVYWDISDKDRQEYINKYGEYFFNDTYPVLIVHNKTLNYSKELVINDFANSWYISIPDSRDEYTVELGRRFKEYVKRNSEMPHKEDINNLLSITYSNDLIMPNDHILTEELKPEIKYKNVKTNEVSYKILPNTAEFYNLYKEIYNLDDISNISNVFEVNNPTSTFKK